MSILGKLSNVLKEELQERCSTQVPPGNGPDPMGSAYLRGKKYYAKFKDALGVWRSLPTDARTLAGALRVASQLEGSSIRNRKDLDASTMPSNASNRPAMVAMGPPPLSEPPVILSDEAPSGTQPILRTLADLMEWWLEEFSDGGRSSQPNRSRTNHHILSQPIGRTPLKELTPQAIERWLHGAEKTGKSAATINHVRISVGVAFNRAIEHGLWDGPNPIERVRKRKAPKKNDHQWLRADEVRPMLDEMPGGWLRNIAAVAVFTGGRKGEVCSLLRSDVDMDARTVTFSKSWEFDSTKGGRSRMVPIIPELVPFLEAQLAATEGQRLLFPAKGGGMLRRDFRLERYLREALAQAGIDRPRIRWHELRHTTGSIMINRGVPVHVVQRVLGHSSVSVTEQVYSHLLSTTVRDEMVRGLAI